jgi:hypothetical protein
MDDQLWPNLLSAAGGSAGDHPAVASRWFQSLLVLEIAK